MDNEITKNQVGIFTVCCGTTEQWEAHNPTLVKGELGYNSSNNRLKIGDGTHAWKELEYMNSKFDYGDITADKISTIVPGLEATKVESALRELLASLNLHKTDTTNPHKVTASQLGAALDIDVKQNTKDIATNTTAITNNKAAIEKNAADIQTNKEDIASNTSSIQANSTSIVNIRKDYVPKAQTSSTSVQGIIQIANDQDISDGVNTTKAITPKQLSEKIATLGTLFSYRGDVATFDDLPLTNNTAGDVYRTLDNNQEWIWTTNGTWDPFGIVIDLSGYYTKEEINPVNIGEIQENTPFDVTQEIVDKVFSDRPIAIQFTFNGLLANLYRLVRTPTEVFYPAQMMLDGITYNYAVRIDRNTKKGRLIRNIEDIIVDGGKPKGGLINGITFPIDVSINPINVVFYKINDVKRSTTRFFTKSNINFDSNGNITRVEFVDKQGNIEGNIVLDVVTKKATYTEHLGEGITPDAFIQVGSDENLNSPSDDLQIGGLFFKEVTYDFPLKVNGENGDVVITTRIPELLIATGVNGDVVLASDRLNTIDDGNGNITLK